jgi:hypothetical protein
MPSGEIQAQYLTTGAILDQPWFSLDTTIKLYEMKNVLLGINICANSHSGVLLVKFFFFATLFPRKSHQNEMKHVPENTTSSA